VEYIPDALLEPLEFAVRDGELILEMGRPVATKGFTDIFPWMTWELKFHIEYLTLPVSSLLLVPLL